MKVNNKSYRTIWIKPDDKSVVQIINQSREYLPHKFVITDLKTSDEFCTAIKEMWVRGAGLIGATAGYAMYIGAREAFNKSKDYPHFLEYMVNLGENLKNTRPTAVNLAVAVDRQLEIFTKNRIESLSDKVTAAYNMAELIANEDAEMCRKIGEHGLKIIEKISKEKNSDAVNILTHCNAGWLAFVDYGSATAPIYNAHNKGIKINVYVDVTSPWNQGSRLTAWELSNEGVSHSIIADNTGGYLMQKGLIDMVITGADRVTRTGDAANKIGTYLKAVAAKDNNIPFYVAFPSSTFDWKIRNGLKEIPIEKRDGEEVKYAYGLDENTNEVKKVLIAPKESPAINYSFDITPARLITGLITERGISLANESDILRLYPEQKYPYQ
jgi:methylthioribose-1-phosphate isomerase